MKTCLLLAFAFSLSIHFFSCKNVQQNPTTNYYTNIITEANEENKRQHGLLKSALNDKIKDYSTYERFNEWKTISDRADSILNLALITLDQFSSSNILAYDSLNQLVRKTDKQLRGLHPELSQHVLTKKAIMPEYAIGKMLFEKDKRLFLNSIKYKLSETQKSLTGFCMSKVGTNDGPTLYYYNRFQTSVFANYRYLKQGDTLELIAGVGTFSSVAMAKYFVQGQRAEVTNGIMHHSKVVSGKPGKYSVPLKIEYRNHDGEVVSEEKIIEYFIVE